HGAPSGNPWAGPLSDTRALVLPILPVSSGNERYNCPTGNVRCTEAAALTAASQTPASHSPRTRLLHWRLAGPLRWKHWAAIARVQLLRLQGSAAPADDAIVNPATSRDPSTASIQRGFMCPPTLCRRPDVLLTTRRVHRRIARRTPWHPTTGCFGL